MAEANFSFTADLAIPPLWKGQAELWWRHHDPQYQSLWHYKSLTTLLVKSDSDFAIYNLFNSSNIKGSSVLSDILYHSIGSFPNLICQLYIRFFTGAFGIWLKGNSFINFTLWFLHWYWLFLSLFLRLPSFSSLFYNPIFNCSLKPKFYPCAALHTFNELRPLEMAGYLMVTLLYYM